MLWIFIFWQTKCYKIFKYDANKEICKRNNAVWTNDQWRIFDIYSTTWGWIFNRLIDADCWPFDWLVFFFDEAVVIAGTVNMCVKSRILSCWTFPHIHALCVKWVNQKFFLFDLSTFQKLSIYPQHVVMWVTLSMPTLQCFDKKQLKKENGTVRKSLRSRFLFAIWGAGAPFNLIL